MSEHYRSCVLIDTKVIGSWSTLERSESSTWREAESIFRIVNSNTGMLKNSVVKVYFDNKNVNSILKKGSRIDKLQSIALNLCRLCDCENIALRPEWIRRTGNDTADYLSRCFDCDDW